MDKETIICRCEEINGYDIDTAIKLGAESFDDVKRITRCGMGPCQSKGCMTLVCDYISLQINKPLQQISPPNIRMPLKLIPLHVLANSGSCTQTSVKSVFEEEHKK